MSPRPKESKGDQTTFGGLSRSDLMSRIRSARNATTELKFVALLRRIKIKGWGRNFPLTGRPDFTFPKSKVAVFLDGCFWHGHNCGRNLTPKSNALAWQAKITRNKNRDSVVTSELKKEGWKVIRIWECALAKRPKYCANRVLRTIIRQSKTGARLKLKLPKTV